MLLITGKPPPAMDQIINLIYKDYKANSFFNFVKFLNVLSGLYLE